MKACAQLLIFAHDHAEEKNDETEDPWTETDEQGELRLVLKNGKVKSRRAQSQKQDCKDDGGGLRILARLENANGIQKTAHAEINIHSRNQPDDKFHGIEWVNCWDGISTWAAKKP